MLKLVDSDALTPKTMRKSQSAHSALTSDSHYFSEPEIDIDSSRQYLKHTWNRGYITVLVLQTIISMSTGSHRGGRPIHRMAITKETNVDDYPAQSVSFHGTLPSQSTNQSLYLNSMAGKL